MNMTTKTLFAAAITGLAITSAQAATITGVTIEDVSSEIATFARTADNTLNGGAGFQAGVQSTHTDSTANGNDMWLSQGNFVSGGAPFDPLPAHITYDLEDNYDLSSFTVWNYNEENATGRGANGVTVSVASSVGGSFTALAGITTFEEAPGDATTAFGETFDLTALAAADNVRLLRIDIATNHGGDNSFAGLSEIRFDGTVVPEPSSSTALLGLGGLALLRRRRK